MILFFFGHRSFIRNKTQTAVINMAMKRMLGNKVGNWKFDVLKTSIFALEAFFSRANICFKNIKFPRGNYQPIVPRQKHSIV